MIIDGEHGTGKTELARKIHDEAFDNNSLTMIDCRLLQRTTLKAISLVTTA